MTQSDRPLAVVTGASTGIGYELARCCAENGFDLIVAADEEEIEPAAEHFRDMGANVEAVKADLATIQGVETLYAATKGRKIDALLANAGIGLGQSFLDQDFNEVIRVIDTNITGTLYLIHRVGRDMRSKRWPHPYHRIDCRLRSRNVSGGLSRHQGLCKFLLLRPAQRA